MTSARRRTAYRPQSNEQAWDTKKGCKVTVKTPPGVYGTDYVWVRSADGGHGWLALCDDLELVEASRS